MIKYREYSAGYEYKRNVEGFMVHGINNVSEKCAGPWTLLLTRLVSTYLVESKAQKKQMMVCYFNVSINFI